VLRVCYVFATTADLCDHTEVAVKRTIDASCPLIVFSRAVLGLHVPPEPQDLLGSLRLHLQHLAHDDGFHSAVELKRLRVSSSPELHLQGC
jgi:hypothetical protein